MTYNAIHYQLKRDFGVASTHSCVCGEPATEWAYQHTGSVQVEPVSGLLYSEDPVDYKPMCRSCHHRLDMQHQNNFLQSRLKNAAKGREVLANLIGSRLAEVRAAQSAGGGRGGCSQRRRCLTCGREMNAAVMGRHQKVNGHVGTEGVS